jgi:alcohol dehydrogenase class IV
VIADWAFPVPVAFGAGRATKEIPALLGAAQRPLVVTDRGLLDSDLVNSIVDSITRSGRSPLKFGDVSANPTDVNIARGADAFRAHGADALIAIGGGSGLDAGKSIAMTARSGVPLEEFEWTRPPPEVAPGDLPPVITVPTTAGTGAEMDSASMYTDTTRRVKRCVAHPALRLQVVADPLLTVPRPSRSTELRAISATLPCSASQVSLPPHLTAWTGMDALTHALEAFSVDSYHPMCDGIALEALRLIKEWLPIAHADGSNVEAPRARAYPRARGAYVVTRTSSNGPSRLRIAGARPHAGGLVDGGGGLPEGAGLRARAERADRRGARHAARPDERGAAAIP